MTLPTRQELSQLLSYDPNTGKLTWKSRPRSMFSSDRACSTWNSRYAGKQAFTATTAKGYHVGAVNNKLYRANRIIFKMIHGYDPIQVDHEDGDNQNDRLSNLREVTGQQNQQNMRRSTSNTSGVTGVIWNAAKGKWDARITVNRKSIHLGRTTDFNEAVSLRKKAERHYGFHPNHGR